MAMISLLDESQQNLVAHSGVSDEFAVRAEPLCRAAAAKGEFSLESTLAPDPSNRTAERSGHEPRLQFFAAAPLITHDEFVLGVLGVLDVSPRRLDPEQVAGLKALAHQVMTHLELRRVIRQRVVAEAQARGSKATLDRVVAKSSDCFLVLEWDGAIISMSPGGMGNLPAARERARPGEDWGELWAVEYREIVRTATNEARKNGSARFEAPLHGAGPRWWDGSITQIAAEGSTPPRLLAVTREITERRRAEQLLKESETRFRSVFQNNVLAIFIWESECFVDANEAALRMLGYPLERYRNGGIPWKSLTPPEYEKRNETMYVRLKDHGQTPTFTEEFFRADGTRMPAELTAAVFPGYRDRGVVFMSDITERRKAEAALLTQERHLRLALESTNLATWESSPDFSHVQWSDRMCDIIGVPRGSAASRERLSTRMPAEEARLFEETIALASDPAIGRFALDHSFRHTDGRLIWLRTTGQGVFGYPPGAPPRCQNVIGTVRDITEQRQAEATLISQERHLRLALESTQLGTWEGPPDLVRLIFTDRARDLLGLPPGEDRTGQWISSRVSAADVKMIRRETAKARDPAVGRFGYEHPFLRPDGARIWLRVTGQGVFARCADGTSYCEKIIGTVRDITGFKNAEAALHSALESSRHANATKDEFLAKLSHELRTPLTPVLMSVSAMIAEEDIPPALRDDLIMIQRNVELEARLIDDLLDVTRIAHGKLELTTELCDVHAVIGHALNVCRPLLETRRIEVLVRFEAPRHFVRGDPTRLQQVFWNLLANAAKFSPEGGRVEIRSEEVEDAMIRLTVADHGRGIAPAILAVLFDAFEQGDRSITREHGGLGLGLAICRGIVALHGGRISACSAGRGLGAEFQVTLPTVATPLARPAAPEDTASEPLAALRILLVEDDEDTGGVLQRLILRAGHRVHRANSIDEALRAAGNHPLDLVISDLGLPDGSGITLMQQLRDTRGLRGIALSGYGTSEDFTLSREAGFMKHLVKPIDWHQLEQAIKELTRK